MNDIIYNNYKKGKIKMNVYDTANRLEKLNNPKNI